MTLSLQKRVLKRLLPSKRSVTYSLFLFLFGTFTCKFLDSSEFITGLLLVLFLSSLVFLIRFLSVPFEKIKSFREVIKECDKKVAKRFLLNFLLTSVFLLAPFVLLELLPFSVWFLLVYALISAWPLSNLLFALGVLLIERRARSVFYRVVVIKTLLNEEYEVATGYTLLPKENH